MSGTNEYLLFCTAAPGTADSLDPASYAGLTTILANGYQTGEASSQQCNTTWRQASMATAALGELIALSGQDALDDRNVTLFATKLLSALAALLPPSHTAGDMKITAYNGSSQPGWLVCDGSVLLRASYPALFTAIGTAFNQPGTDINHFNIPDMRGMFPRGYDAGRGVDVGRVFGSYQADKMPAHVHSVDLQPLNSADAGGYGKLATGNNVAEGIIPPFNTASAGVGSETVVKNLALCYFICTGQ